MRKVYRVYVVGDIPSDLKERIAQLHATGILKGKEQDTLLPNRDLHLHKEKASKSKTIEYKNKS